MDKCWPGIDEPPSFALRLGHKDVSLATELGREVGVPMRLANLALEEITEALNRGWGDRDSSSFMLLEEKRAGVQIAVPLERLEQILEQDGRGGARPGPPGGSKGRQNLPGRSRPAPSTGA